jgi:hypothetical protein
MGLLPLRLHGSSQFLSGLLALLPLWHVLLVLLSRRLCGRGMHGDSPEPIDEPHFPTMRSLPLLPTLPAQDRICRLRSRSVPVPLQLLRCFRIPFLERFLVSGYLDCNNSIYLRDAAINILFYALWPSVPGHAPSAPQRLLPAPSVPSGTARHPRVAPAEQADRAVLLAMQRVSSVARIQPQRDLAWVVPLCWNPDGPSSSQASK